MTTQLRGRIAEMPEIDHQSRNSVSGVGVQFRLQMFENRYVPALGSENLRRSMPPATILMNIYIFLMVTPSVCKDTFTKP